MTPLRACVDLAFCLLYKITCLPFLSFMAVLVNSVLRWIALQYYTAEACKITEQTFNLANIFECQPSTFDKLPTPNSLSGNTTSHLWPVKPKPLLQ
ncbi:hypothetical protein AB205_0028060 [Aquarana catesbeiana]|uniref:Uncharacterized protein n=1 Tax=Aquarana catesbeiana TaxID=8400 RepID=A0A2G9RWE6_AQUCT|nr:hypothetical protein AB205_0028060 [Aquarana catesbeiana]